MSRLFAGWAWQVSLTKCDYGTEYVILKEQDRVRCCRNYAVVSDGSQENQTPGAGLNVNFVPENVDDEEDWELDGTIGAESVQLVGMERKLLDLHDECRMKK